MYPVLTSAEAWAPCSLTEVVRAEAACSACSSSATVSVSAATLNSYSSIVSTSDTFSFI